MLGSFERADARGDSRICVGAARSQHAGGESRVVSAAVLSVEHEADIEHMRLFRSEFFIRSYRIENRLGGAEGLVDRVEIHALVIEVAALDLIGVAHYHWYLREQLYRLAKDVFYRDIVRIFVI